MRKTAIDIDVDKIEASERRNPTVREALSLNPDTEVVRLETSTATLEWAVLDRQLDWALDHLSPPANRG